MSRKTQIFTDASLNKELNENGYVIVPFFSKEALQKVFQEIQAKRDNQVFVGNQNDLVEVDYHCTFLDDDVQYRTDVFNTITQLFTPVLKQYLQDYKFAQTNLFNKPSGKGYVAPHQNLTILNEEKYTSLSMWCPLQDTDKNNGTLYLLPKSHKERFARYRNADINMKYEQEFDFGDNGRLTPISVKAGELLIFDDAMIHGSPENYSTHDRYVFHALAVPSEAQVVYCKKEGNRMKIYGVEDDFWQYFVPGTDAPTENLLEDLPYTEISYPIEKKV